MPSTHEHTCVCRTVYVSKPLLFLFFPETHALPTGRLNRYTRRMQKGWLCIGLLLGLFFLQPVQSAAQAARFQVKGRVTATDNLPLEGVSVTVKGTTQGTSTDRNGQYTISAENDRVTLVFSSIGYGTRELAVNGRNTVDASLTTEIKEADEVVVIGYQTIRRRNLLASVSSVSARDLKDIPVNSAAEALNGRLAGVTATTAEGSPDAEVRVRIRGGMSITGDNSPLYIVDGVQVENGLTHLSPQNIQTIDVLKDASATAIYGARGANGVIVITTKSGRPGRVSLSYNGFIGVKKLARKLDVLNPYDYVIYQSERSRGSSTDSPNTLP